MASADDLSALQREACTKVPGHQDVASADLLKRPPQSDRRLRVQLLHQIAVPTPTIRNNALNGGGICPAKPQGVAARRPRSAGETRESAPRPKLEISDVAQVQRHQNMRVKAILRRPL